jgi:hypothetical protein
MRFSPFQTRGTAIVRETLSCLAAAAFALALAAPAFAAEAKDGSMEPAPLTGPDKAAPKGEAGTQAVTYDGSVFPLRDTDTYRVRLPGGNGRVFTFALYNFTPGFNPAMIIRGAGRTFRVNRTGPNGNEIYKVTVRGTVTASVTVGAFRGSTVGNYALRVTP